jgi:16S rRNA C967 or C1407 C5-methylase (RsmB/RsmF family)/NOL1/NOP2/fmu family ribosome biogenesis protein
MPMLPELFVNRITQQLQQEAPLFFEALQQTTPVSIRINTQKIETPLPYEKIAWAHSGYYLKERPAFVFDPLWHSGAYYVQEASSMLVEYVFKQLFSQPENLNVLDLCAAPGGKSTLLSALLAENSLLVANEVIAARNSLLRENLVRWGNPNVVVTQNDPQDFQKLPHFFDCILIDAPCSGEGLFRKEPEAVNEWSEANLQLCVARQKRIVADVLPSLKPNGYLIYSTCTYNPEENENQIATLIKEQDLTPVEIHYNTDWGMVQNAFFGLHCFPHKVKGEGFFIAVLQKTSEEKSATEKVRNKLNIVAAKERKALDNLLLQPEKYEWIAHKENFHFFSSNKIDEFNLLLQSLYVKHFGTIGAQVKHQDIIPQPDLAFSTAFNQKHFSSVELDAETALKFLRKDTLELEAAQGWNTVQFKNIPLGFIKANEHRINNYYPIAWRLRKELVPASCWSLLG